MLYDEVVQKKKKKMGKKNGVERKKSQPRDRGRAQQKEENKMEEKEKNFPTDIFPTVRKKSQRTYFSNG
jgi:hypothetical protein